MDNLLKRRLPDEAKRSLRLHKMVRAKTRTAFSSSTETPTTAFVERKSKRRRRTDKREADAVRGGEGCTTVLEVVDALPLVLVQIVDLYIGIVQSATVSSQRLRVLDRVSGVEFLPAHPDIVVVNSHTSVRLYSISERSDSLPRAVYTKTAQEKAQLPGMENPLLQGENLLLVGDCVLFCPILCEERSIVVHTLHVQPGPNPSLVRLEPMPLLNEERLDLFEGNRAYLQLKMIPSSSQRVCAFMASIDASSASDIAMLATFDQSRKKNETLLASAYLPEYAGGMSDICCTADVVMIFPMTTMGETSVRSLHTLDLLHRVQFPTLDPSVIFTCPLTICQPSVCNDYSFSIFYSTFSSSGDYATHIFSLDGKSDDEWSDVKYADVAVSRVILCGEQLLLLPHHTSSLVRLQQAKPPYQFSDLQAAVKDSEPGPSDAVISGRVVCVWFEAGMIDIYKFKSVLDKQLQSTRQFQF